MRGFTEFLWRWVRKLVNGTAFLMAAGLITVLAAVYFAIHKPYLPWLRPLLPAVGRIVAGYDITSVDLRVRVDPTRQHIAGEAELWLQLVGGQGSVSLLLDPGLRVEGVTTSRADEEPQAIPFLQVGPFLTVDLGRRNEGAVAIRIVYEGRPVSLRLLKGAKLSSEDILLPPEALWYPTNAQSFFSYSLRAELPADLEVVHAAASVNRLQRGRVQEWQWSGEGRVAGLALIAGKYQRFARSGAPPLRAYVHPKDGSIAGLILEQVKNSHAALRSILGASGLPAVSVFIHPSLDRAFYDGAGVIGLPRAALASPDQGFGLVAHEVAHIWWGGTVSGGWLVTGGGSQWITEGFAEASSILATETMAGLAGRTARLFGEFFDPAQQQIVSEMTVLDNAIESAQARETIYRKGSYTAWMLRSLLGPGKFADALRSLCERYRFQNISDREVEEVFEEVSGQPLDGFFSSFVRGNEQLDFHVDVGPGGHLQVALARPVPFPGKVRLWLRQGAAERWQERQVELPYELEGVAGATEVWVDPQLEWPDMQRENNRFPRQSDPLYVTPAGEQVLVTWGDPFPWSRATAQLRDAEGKPLQTWQFDRGFLGPLQFDTEHGWFIGSLADGTPGPPALVLLKTNGDRRVVGRGNGPALGKEGAVYAALGDRVVRVGPSGRVRTLVRHPGQRVGQLRLQTATNRLAYTAQTHDHTIVYTLEGETGKPMPQFSWELAPLRIEWLGTQNAFVVAAVDAVAWRVWEVDLDEGSAAPIAQDVFALADLAASPEGGQIALTALPYPAYPGGQRSVFVLDRIERQARSFSAPETDFLRIAWESETSLLTVGQTVPGEEARAYPLRRSLYRIPLPEGPPQPLP